jgi:hypothetical protein
MPCNGVPEELINSKILGLIFGMLEKVWSKYEIYLYGYAKGVKTIQLISDLIDKTHNENLNNVFHVVQCFFSG